MKEGFLEAPSDSVELYWRHWPAASAQAACVLIHGIGEHLGRYDWLAQALNSRGFSVWGMDHRGHGRSGGLRGDCRSFKQFLEDLELLLQTQVKKGNSNLSIFLVGHSLGGRIALEYAVQHPEQIAGAAVSSPALKLANPVPLFKEMAAHVLSILWPTAAIPNGVNPHVLCRDKEVVKAYIADPLIHRKITARCAMILKQVISESMRLAGQIQIPCLILQAGADQVVDAQASEQFAELTGSRGTFHRYANLYHELFNEPEKEQVVADLTEWMKKQLS